MIDRQLAERIRIVGLDVDGVLTDGGIYLGDMNGLPLELKRYHIQDGLGIRFLRQAGIRVAIITGRVSESVRLRAAELEIDDVVQDPGARKLPAFRAMLERNDLDLTEAAFVGDDFPDMAVMREVALPVAVGNAVTEVRQVAKVKLERGGGHGAVREFAEILLRARGSWEHVWQQYVRERSVLPREVRA